MLTLLRLMCNLLELANANISPIVPFGPSVVKSSLDKLLSAYLLVVLVHIQAH